jgi:hypothetical protein
VPRKNKFDHGYYTPQKKIEASMHLMVHFLEHRQDSTLAEAAALQRSAWEDLQQNRRSLLAGKQSFKLQPRSDATRPKLLTEEEQKKIYQPKPKFRQFKGNQQWGKKSQDPPSTSSSSFTFSSSKGKGKGKGRSKSQQSQS